MTNTSKSTGSLRNEVISYLVALVATVLAGAMVLYVRGDLGMFTEQAIPTSMIKKELGYCSIVPIGIHKQGQFGISPRVKLFENEEPIGPEDDLHKNIRELGSGRFSHWAQDIYFSTPDNSDPASNGRSYSIRYIKIPPAWLLFGLFAFWVIACGPALKRIVRLLEQLPAPVLPIVFFALAIAYRLYVQYRNPALTFDGHIVRGLPFSDARAWDTLSGEFASGDRADSSWPLWNARRPFYYWLFGSIYVFTGACLQVTYAVKIFLGGLGAVFILDGMRRIAPLPVALVAVSAHTFLSYDAFESLIPRTEGLGYFLTNLAFWFAVLTFQYWQSDRKHSGKMAILTGAALGLANLARPLNPGAVGLYPILFGWLATKSDTLTGAASKAIKIGIFVVVGCLLTCGPWIVRQHLRYGINSLSDNSGEMILAASSPEYGSWDSRVSSLYPDGYSDLGKRHDYYRTMAEKSIQEHFEFYIHNVWNYAVRLAQDISIPIIWFLLIVAFMSSAVWGEAARSIRAAIGALITAGILGGIALIVPYGNVWFWVISLFVALILRHSVSLIGGLVLPSVLMLALCAFAGERMTYGLYWQTAAISAWGAWVFSQVFCSWNEFSKEVVEQQLRIPGWSSSWIRGIRYGALLTAFALLVGWGIAIARDYRPDTTPELAIVDAELSKKVVSMILENPDCAPFQDLRPFLTVRKGQLRHDYITNIEAHAQINHWSHLFDERPYAYSAFEILPRAPENHLIYPGPLDGLHENEEYLFLGIPRIERGDPMFEVVAIFVERGENIDAIKECAMAPLPYPAFLSAEKEAGDLIAQ